MAVVLPRQDDLGRLPAMNRPRLLSLDQRIKETTSMQQTTNLHKQQIVRNYIQSNT